jgi:hypothetical protein
LLCRRARIFTFYFNSPQNFFSLNITLTFHFIDFLLPSLPFFKQTLVNNCGGCMIF